MNSAVVCIGWNIIVVCCHQKEYTVYNILFNLAIITVLPNLQQTIKHRYANFV